MPDASAFAVAVSVDESAIAPVTETVPEPSDARTDGAVPSEHAVAPVLEPPFLQTSAVAEAAAPAMPMPAASADDFASGRAVEIDVTLRLGAAETLPSMYARVAVNERATVVTTPAAPISPKPPPSDRAIGAE